MIGSVGSSGSMLAASMREARLLTRTRDRQDFSQIASAFSWLTLA